MKKLFVGKLFRSVFTGNAIRVTVTAIEPNRLHLTACKKGGNTAVSVSLDPQQVSELCSELSAWVHSREVENAISK